MITITLDGEQLEVAEGTTVAAAILNARVNAFRTSVAGEARGPLCAMGICFECRVTIGDLPQQRSCTILVSEGMEVRTAE